MIFQTLFLIAVAGRIWVEFCRIEVLNMQIDFWRIHNVHIWVFRIRSSVILCDGGGGGRIYASTDLNQVATKYAKCQNWEIVLQSLARSYEWRGISGTVYTSCDISGFINTLCHKFKTDMLTIPFLYNLKLTLPQKVKINWSPFP